MTNEKESKINIRVADDRQMEMTVSHQFITHTPKISVRTYSENTPNNLVEYELSLEKARQIANFIIETIGLEKTEDEKIDEFLNVLAKRWDTKEETDPYDWNYSQAKIHTMDGQTIIIQRENKLRGWWDFYRYEDGWIWKCDLNGSESVPIVRLDRISSIEWGDFENEKTKPIEVKVIRSRKKSEESND